MASAVNDKGEETAIDLLQNLDFSSIEDLDPSLGKLILAIAYIFSTVS